MDFGDLLNEWEERSAKPGGLDKAAEAERRARGQDFERRSELARRAERSAKPSALLGFESWLDSHSVPDKDGESRDEDDHTAREAETRRLKALKPQARIDLHGMVQAEAEAALGAFLELSSRRGLEKVLIVTGKGNHSKGEPVLGRAARHVLEASPYAGRFGTADPSDGGNGALWVLLRGASISRGR